MPLPQPAAAAAAAVHKDPESMFWLAAMKGQDCDGVALRHQQQLYAKALASAMQTANKHRPVLHPVLIYWGEPTEYTRQLQTDHPLTIVVHTRLSFADDLPSEIRQGCDCGAYLRLDIPRILETDARIQERFLRSNGTISREHAFYTDTDMLFLRPVEWRADVLPALPHFNGGHGPVLSYGASGIPLPSMSSRPWNTGVMFLSISGLSGLAPHLVKFGVDKGFPWWYTSRSYDQALFKAFAEQYPTKLRRKVPP
jgi:hypothetical protein